ncbi:MAG TPA: DDE-type integrase/transposase/recombinase, partial [Trueperaceae bacterium]|nr:DDE-type integrase/transposase/recombinase [Trueperaceae bacterium]
MFHEAEAPILMTVRDIAEILRRSERTVRRWVDEAQARTEYVQVPTSSGNTVRQLLVDVQTLPEPIRSQLGAAGALRPNAESLQTAPAVVTVALEASLKQILARPEGGRAELVATTAKKFGVSQRTVYRRLAKLAEPGLEQRSDLGRPRIPEAAYALIVSAILENEQASSTRAVHRALLRLAPDVMSYERGGRLQEISVTTIGRIRRALEEDPRHRLMFSDLDAREELLRTYSGSIVVPHANYLWMIDMTRCDILVVDPESGAIFRPRVHAIIDVYSGCIPGIVFSREEDQAQTDLVLMRAMLPKRGPWAASYPIRGNAMRLGADNGSTYISAQFRRATAGVGTKLIHRKPYASHTGGPIERFFGSLHSYEKTLVGYVGPNAANRSTKELRRLERNTREWLKHKRDPGEKNRLYTINEYQDRILAWLVGEYHQWKVGGQTRLERFLTTAPESTMLQLDEQELLLHLAHRTERTVDAAGRFRLNNRLWSIPDGSLAPYAGVRVTVLSDQFALEPDRHLVAWLDRRGVPQIIGEARPAPEIASSIAEHEHLIASRAAVAEEIRRQREMMKALADPNTRISTVLLKELRAHIAPEAPTGPRAHLE